MSSASVTVREKSVVVGRWSFAFGSRHYVGMVESDEYILIVLMARCKRVVGAASVVARVRARKAASRADARRTRGRVSVLITLPL